VVVRIDIMHINTSPNFKSIKLTPLIITKVIKSRRIRWAGHVARMGEVRNAHCILVGKP
jgi:hypothetical protein